MMLEFHYESLWMLSSRETHIAESALHNRDGIITFVILFPAGN